MPAYITSRKYVETHQEASERHKQVIEVLEEDPRLKAERKRRVREGGTRVAEGEPHPLKRNSNTSLGDPLVEPPLRIVVVVDRRTCRLPNVRRYPPDPLVRP